MGLSYARQQTEKRRRFASCWSKAGLPRLPAVSWHETKSKLRYRNRIRCQVTNEGDVHFFNPNKLEDCGVLEPGVHHGIAVARAWASRDPSLWQSCSHLEVRTKDADGWGALVLGSPANPSPPLRTAEMPADWTVAWRGQSDVPCQRWWVANDVWIDVPVDGFMQINSAVNRLLVGHVREGLVARGARSFADLYMGSGNFALPLLVSGLEGWGVEAHAAGVRAAETAAGAQDAQFSGLAVADAVAQAAAWLAAGVRPDAVVVDPPRAGLREGASVVAALPRTILVMCSCNPRSLCSDLAKLLDQFVIEEVALFDMAPQTSQLEVVVWLRRRS